MTPGRAKELLPIIQAFADGKEIQYRHTSDCEWQTRNDISFGGAGDYRIKPAVIKYRRYIYCIYGNKLVQACNGSDVDVKAVEAMNGFTRWIDKDWQEVEV